MRAFGLCGAALAISLGIANCGDGRVGSDGTSGDDSGGNDANDALSLCSDGETPPVLLSLPGCSHQPAEVSWVVESGRSYDISYSRDGLKWKDADFVDDEEGVVRADDIGETGAYFWRIRTILPDCRSAYSPAFPFEVSPTPELPKLTVEDTCEGDSLVVRWPDESEPSYELEYREIDGDDDWQAVATHPGRAAISSLDPGVYALPMTASLGACSSTSSPDDHVKGVVEPLPVEPRDLSDDCPITDVDAAIEMSWEGPDLGNYEVELTAPDGESWTRTISAMSGTRLVFEFDADTCVRPGDYTWSVRHVTRCGEGPRARKQVTVWSPGSVTSWTRHDIGVHPGGLGDTWGKGDNLWVLASTDDGDYYVAKYDGSDWTNSKLPGVYSGLMVAGEDNVWVHSWSEPALRQGGDEWVEAGPQRLPERSRQSNFAARGRRASAMRVRHSSFVGGWVIV